MKSFIVKDSCGEFLRKFSTFKEAQAFKDTYNRQDWTIYEKRY